MEPLKTWRKHATVWVNDPEKRRVIVGQYGFAWWRGRRVFIAVFDQRTDKPMSAYSSFTTWDEVREYEAEKCPNSAVFRFVRTGLLPG